MTESKFHLAQVNIAHLIAPQGDPRVQSFFDNVPRINALAESSMGFVWRYEGDYPDPLVAFNMSVWESMQALRDYVYRSDHVEIFRRKDEWMQTLHTPHLAMWWIPVGSIPTVQEGLDKLAHLEQHGASSEAFTFSDRFPAPV